MKIKKGDKLPDAKVFILEKEPKEVWPILESIPKKGRQASRLESL